MTRSRAALFALLLWAVPATAQVVGSTPDASPYRDLPWKQSLALFGGGFDTGRDEAGVGPQPGWLAGVRYDLRLGGPVSLVGRIAGGPTSRRLILPSKPLKSRYVGDQNSQLLVADLGIAVNLTGQKSWHRLIPVVSSGVGVASDFRGTPDAGGYRFGTQFMLSYGLGLRYDTDGRWEPRVDFTSFLWRLHYPPEYAQKGSDGSAPAVTGGKSPWMGNHLWSAGVAYQLFR